MQSSRETLPIRRLRSRGPAAGVVLTLAIALVAARAEAQQQVQGFALERLYPSAPGGGWVVMDALDMHGGIGGVVGLLGSYAYQPLRVSSPDGSQKLSVVSNQAFADIALAITYDRFKVYLDLANPLVTSGSSGTVGGYQFTAPSVVIGRDPDFLSDGRIGFDVRLIGDATSPFRLGASAQLFTPNGTPTMERVDYRSDDTFRGMLRMLIAGDVRRFTYAGQLGVHIRPLDDSPAPGSPHGSELLFGVAMGRKFPLGSSGTTVFVVGPELFGETAFRSFYGSKTTGIEGLLTGRLEQTTERGPLLRFKLATGGGIHAQFGAPEWRFVAGLEISGHAP